VQEPTQRSKQPRLRTYPKTPSCTCGARGAGYPTFRNTRQTARKGAQNEKTKTGSISLQTPQALITNKAQGCYPGEPQIAECPTAESERQSYFFRLASPSSFGPLQSSICGSLRWRRGAYARAGAEAGAPPKSHRAAGQRSYAIRVAGYYIRRWARAGMRWRVVRSRSGSSVTCSTAGSSPAAASVSPQGPSAREWP